mmetsp:Transcript_90628/g.259154  ORF Transcript_90628/g.259154 Transcript_90628/m.259154 type:complete len:272 (+) Transcript_90628:770-1585(+)
MHCLGPCVHPLGIRVLHLLWKWSFYLCRLEGFAIEAAPLQEFQSNKARLLQVRRRILQDGPKQRRASLRLNEVQILENHEVHQGRQALDIVGARGISPACDVLQQKARSSLVFKLVRMPSQAELEVDAFVPLSFHLCLQHLLCDVPFQALLHVWADCSRSRRQVCISSRKALADLVRVPESLAQDLFFLEALVQVPRDQTQAHLTVLLQVAQQVSELHRVYQWLRLVSPLTLRQRLRQLVGNDACKHQVVQAVRQLLPHDHAKVIRHLRRR